MGTRSQELRLLQRVRLYRILKGGGEEQTVRIWCISKQTNMTLDDISFVSAGLSFHSHIGPF
jgi:hypothetical protein